MQQNILNFYARSNTGFLHGLGEKGTEFLFDKLDLVGDEKVLEYGCGTGSSLVKLKSRFPELDLIGIDKSELMLQKAKSRLKFCGLHNSISLSLSTQRDQVTKASLDLIYVESVLAIQEKLELAKILIFMNSRLKKGGLLAMNESIWRETTSIEEIRQINDLCKEEFGIIQCTELFPNISQTTKYLESFGFNNLYSQRLNHNDNYNIKRRKIKDLLSYWYSKSGKVKRLFNSSLRKLHQSNNSKMRNIFQEDKEYLSGTIWVLEKV